MAAIFHSPEVSRQAEARRPSRAARLFGFAKLRRSGGGGGGAQKRPESAGRGPMAPAPRFLFGGPAHPNGNPLPLRQRASGGPTAVARGRRKEGPFLRGAAAFRGRGQRPRPLNMPAAGHRPAAGGWAQPTRRRPPRYGFHHRQKGNEKPGPTLYGAWHLTDRKKGQGPAPTPRAKPLPMPYGQRRLHPPAAGYRRKPTAPACARLSPSAQDLR